LAALIPPSQSPPGSRLMARQARIVFVKLFGRPRRLRDARPSNDPFSLGSCRVPKRCSASRFSTPPRTSRDATLTATELSKITPGEPEGSRDLRTQLVDPPIVVIAWVY